MVSLSVVSFSLFSILQRWISLLSSFIARSRGFVLNFFVSSLSGQKRGKAVKGRMNAGREKTSRSMRVCVMSNKRAIHTSYESSHGSEREHAKKKDRDPPKIGFSSAYHQISCIPLAVRYNPPLALTKHPVTASSQLQVKYQTVLTSMDAGKASPSSSRA